MEYVTKFNIFSHSDIYSDISNILSKIPLTTVEDIVAYTARGVCEFRDHANTCEIVSHRIHVLLDQLFIE